MKEERRTNKQRGIKKKIYKISFSNKEENRIEKENENESKNMKWKRTKRKNSSECEL